MEDNEEFIWRFKIDEKPSDDFLDDPLNELIRVQWEELLKLTIPTFNGEEVKIDGFRTMNNLKINLPIFRDKKKVN